MAQAQAQINIIDDDASFLDILQAFTLSLRARQRFTEDYPTINDLMGSTKAQVENVIYNQNRIYRNHATAAQRCYINQTQTLRILALRRFAIIAIREGGAFYEPNDAPDFSLAWINTIQEEYNQKDPDPTTPGPLVVNVPKFKGNNWYLVKSQFLLALQTVYGQSGVPLSYLIRETRVNWEDTDNHNDYPSLQSRRVASKDHSGADFNKDNVELYRILGQEMDGTTLEDVVKATAGSNGVRAWENITNNVEGAHYNNELRRDANAIADSAFWDPSKQFSFESYFQKHTQYHDKMQKAGEPVSDWTKIEKFMSGIRCEKLKSIFINGNFDGYSFTQFYNYINEKYRRLVAEKMIRPASIYKRKISQMDSDNHSYSGRGRGRGRGGRGGRFNRGGGRGRGRGRGRGGRGSDSSTINWSLLPNGFDPNGNLSFDDNTWYNFSRETRREIDKLRKLQQQQRNINSALSTYQSVDDNSTIATNRTIFSLINVPNQQQGAPLPPPPQQQQQQPPSNSGNTRSSNAGAAFGPSE